MSPLSPMPTLAHHPARGALLSEVHARPFALVEAPARFRQLAFVLKEGESVLALSQLKDYAIDHGLPAPIEGAKHAHLKLGRAELRFELHTEFVTQTWKVPQTGVFEPFSEAAAFLPSPGEFLIGIDLEVIKDHDALDLTTIFDPTSLAISSFDEGLALIATDFRATPEGFVRILILDRGLNPARIGATVQRMLELETYRMMALLGLPEAQRLSPIARDIENNLAILTRKINMAGSLEDNEKLLKRLTSMAASVEAEIAASRYRFGATNAYVRIMQNRLEAVQNKGLVGFPTLASFLDRRMSPAIETCRTVENWLTQLSDRLTRAGDLMRTRIDVDIARQNRDLLATMNARTQAQLKLQQTVEGLSIAAISYYVVNLIILFLEHIGAEHIAASVYIYPLLVPLVLLCVGLAIRRIHRKHGADKAHPEEINRPQETSLDASHKTSAPKGNH